MRKPVQVYLEDTDLERLESWSRARGWTKSQAIRLAIRALTQPPANDPLLELSGMFEGLPSDLSENFDRYLDKTYVAEERAVYKRRGRSPSRLRR